MKEIIKREERGSQSLLGFLLTFIEYTACVLSTLSQFHVLAVLKEGSSYHLNRASRDSGFSIQNTTNYIPDVLYTAQLTAVWNQSTCSIFRDQAEDVRLDVTHIFQNFMICPYGGDATIHIEALDR